MIHKSEIKVKDPIRAEIEAQVAEYLAKGGEIKRAEPDARLSDQGRIAAHLRGYEARIQKTREREQRNG